MSHGGYPALTFFQYQNQGIVASTGLRLALFAGPFARIPEVYGTPTVRGVLCRCIVRSLSGFSQALLLYCQHQHHHHNHHHHIYLKLPSVDMTSNQKNTAQFLNFPFDSLPLSSRGHFACYRYRRLRQCHLCCLFPVAVIFLMPYLSSHLVYDPIEVLRALVLLHSDFLSSWSQIPLRLAGAWNAWRGGCGAAIARSARCAGVTGS